MIYVGVECPCNTLYAISCRCEKKRAFCENEICPESKDGIFHDILLGLFMPQNIFSLRFYELQQKLKIKFKLFDIKFIR